MYNFRAHLISIFNAITWRYNFSNNTLQLTIEGQLLLPLWHIRGKVNKSHDPTKNQCKWHLYDGFFSNVVPLIFTSWNSIDLASLMLKTCMLFLRSKIQIGSCSFACFVASKNSFFALFLQIHSHEKNKIRMN